MRDLVPFHKLSEPQVAELIATYLDAFEAHWEWPPSQILELVRAESGRFCAVAALDDETVAGFIIAEHLSGGNLWYIHYLAVRPELRSQGWGTYLLTSSMRSGEEAARRSSRDGCIGAAMEVEAVDGPPVDADREQRVRRHVFYRRQGALPTGVLVPRPPWAPPEMPDWDVLVIPMSAWQGRIDAAFCRTLLRSVLVEGYGFSEDAPWLAAALAALTDDTQTTTA